MSLSAGNKTLSERVLGFSGSRTYSAAEVNSLIDAAREEGRSPTTGNGGEVWGRAAVARLIEAALDVTEDASPNSDGALEIAGDARVGGKLIVALRRAIADLPTPGGNGGEVEAVARISRDIGGVANLLEHRMSTEDDPAVRENTRQATKTLRDAARAILALPRQGVTGLDTPLPCDVTVAHMTFRKGVKLRTFVDAAARWHAKASEALALPRTIGDGGPDSSSRAVPDSKPDAATEAGS